ncbi:MAG: beta-ketoacyl-ACP synthase II [Chlamydiales bacterium]|nr:beta-ketoacyl-ACP synthase II [Chlamydiales bacterium]NCF70322.1 beta-ketoacyl-ACP synthase II [Chlamydiales bacterium]
MANKRVVITGMGVVSCYGDDVDTFYNSLLDGKSGVSKIERFDVEGYSTQFAAQVKEVDAEPYIQKKMLRRVDPFITYSMVSAKKAVEKANLDCEKVNKSRCGILMGSGMGGMQTFSDGIETLITKGPKRVSPFFVPFILTNMAGGLLSIDLGFTGPNYSISTACATATNCIVSAWEHIQKSEADLMICGGAEASVIPIGVTGFMAIKALSQRNDAPTQASRPWDKGRDGFVIGEGAGALVIETLDHALERNAPILAELVSGAVNADAYHMTEPKAGGGGVAACIQSTLKQGGVVAEQINYINAHATSTQAGDLVEIDAYRNVFGQTLPSITINATKSMVGHSLGAAGALEAVATVKAIETQRVHPTINLEDPEDAVKDLDIMFKKAKEVEIDYALSNSFGFGGHNASVLFKKYQA